MVIGRARLPGADAAIPRSFSSCVAGRALAEKAVESQARRRARCAHPETTDNTDSRDKKEWLTAMPSSG